MKTEFFKSKIKFEVLEKDEIEEIFLASLDILERVGVKVFSSKAIEIFKKNGCILSDGNTVHIPKGLVKSSLNTVPESINIYNRLGELDLILEDKKNYFGTGSDCPNFIDPFTGKRRRSNNDDVINSAIISDFLPQIDFHMSLSMASDYSPDVYYIHQYVLMLENTIKPLILTAKDEKNLDKIFKIAALIAGGEKEFKLKPNFILYDEPSSPLFHTETAINKLIYASEKNIPIIYTPCPISGATATVTKTGTLVSSICESLSGIVLAQIINPGMSVIMGGVLSNLDMSTTIMPYASPEFLVMSAALTEVAQYLKIPMFSTAGCSDSKIMDAQASSEATDSLYMAALSGANLIHDVGYLESGLTGSLEMVVLCDEIISKIKKVLSGIEVNEETLLRNVIGKVGPCNSFLEDESTLKFFRKEFYITKIMDRNNYVKWFENGSKELVKILNEKVINILNEHRPVKLDKTLMKEIEKILNS